MDLLFVLGALVLLAAGSLVAAPDQRMVVSTRGSWAPISV